MNQCDMVLRHLKDVGSITSLDAMNEYGIMRLASRISDLKKRGHKITSKIVHGKNRYNEQIFYKEYFMEE